MANSVVCTLSEGHYHYGVAALCNSLYRCGFRGRMWVGGRGEIPLWTSQGKRISETEFDFDGVALVFKKVEAPAHLANFKPQFMEQVFEGENEASRVFYFDPDITCQASWGFFEDWADQGIALCEDACYTRLPADHPTRAKWRRLGHKLGMELKIGSDAYYNSGFIGVTRANRSFLKLWQTISDAIASEGVDLKMLKSESREDPYQNRDQDTLNLAGMSADYQLSTIGAEAMGFAPAGYIMQHAVDSPKPWKKRYLLHFLRTGERPGMAHRAFWDHVLGPVFPCSATQIRLKKLEMGVVVAGARFYRR